MESQENHPKVALLWDKSFEYYLLGIGLIVLLAVVLITGTTFTELNCTRSPLHSVECQVVRNTRFLKMSPIKIIDPIAVDVIQHETESKGQFTYTAEIRSHQYSYSIIILADMYSKLPDEIANKVNDFLLRSDATSFSIRF
jgi:hypothetical protein